MIFKHGLRAALTPIVTIFGMDLGLLLGGAIITEYTFSLHGLGLFTIEAVQTRTCRRSWGSRCWPRSSSSSRTWWWTSCTPWSTQG